GCISIDTRRAAVAEAAIRAGARVVNDVSAGEDPRMLPLVAASPCTIVLMHMRGDPGTMQSLTRYGDVCAEVWGTLDGRADGACAARLGRDPGPGMSLLTAYFANVRGTDVVDIALLWFVVYRALLLMRGTRAFQSLLGLLLALVLYVVSGRLELYAVHWMLE